MNFVDNIAARERDKIERRVTIRRISRNTIARILAETKGRREIEIDLALGAACPFITQWERDIWIDEIHLQLKAAANA